MLCRGKGAFWVIYFLSVLPQVSHAQVAISEVMYDPAGTDTKREWIEVCNVGSNSADLTTFKLFESGSNHGIVAFSGGNNLDAGACGVIADDPASFKMDYPGFSGFLFDSSFSLSNSGEQLVIKNTSDVDVDSTTYPATAAKGDGNSLHRSGGTYSAGPATPGSESGFSAPQSSGSSGDVDANQVNQNGNTATPASGVSSVINFQTVTVEPTPKLTVRTDMPETSVVGMLVKMNAEAYNTKGQVVKAGIRWAFGDGASDTGAEVRHAYLEDGSYAVHVSATLDGLNDSVVVPIVVRPLSIAISASDDGKTIIVRNNGEGQIDLTAWKIRVGGQYYIFPDNTFILGNATVKFSQNITKITEVLLSKYVELVNPSGDRVADFHTDPKQSNGAQNAVTQDKQSPLSIAPITLAGLRHEDVVVEVADVVAPSPPPIAQPVAQLFEQAKLTQNNSFGKESVPSKNSEVVSISEEVVEPQQASASSSGFQMNIWYVAIGLLAFVGAAPLFFATFGQSPAPAKVPEQVSLRGLYPRNFEIVEVNDEQLK